MNPVIEVSGLCKKYGDFAAVNDLTFTVFHNEIFGLLGPNGAGKTTTINMLCGLLAATGGSIKFRINNGKDHKSLIGYCPQENIFYPRLTCLEQLQFTGSLYGIPGPESKNRALRLLEMLGLNDKVNARASELSGGMKRRLNICLALIHDPEILILDEPEAGLDPQSRLLVRDFIRKFGNDKTVILTTHNMDEADRMADRVAIIDYGRLLMLDTPDRLKRTAGEGDMLEIITEHADEIQVKRFAEIAGQIAEVVSIGDCNILFRRKNMVVLLPDIRKIADESGIQIGEMKLRENTLEDVFIQLTGRNLRQ